MGIYDVLNLLAERFSVSQNFVYISYSKRNTNYFTLNFNFSLCRFRIFFIALFISFGALPFSYTSFIFVFLPLAVGNAFALIHAPSIALAFILLLKYIACTKKIVVRITEYKFLITICSFAYFT